MTRHSGREWLQRIHARLFDERTCIASDGVTRENYPQWIGVVEAMETVARLMREVK